MHVGRPPSDPNAMRVLILTMDSHFGTAITTAQAMLRRSIPNLELVLHAAD